MPRGAAIAWYENAVSDVLIVIIVMKSCMQALAKPWEDVAINFDHSPEIVMAKVCGIACA
jgi:hypothetical protein